MTHEEAKQIVLERIKLHAKVTNSELLELVGHDQGLLLAVREDLILHDLAEDYKQVGLVYCRPEDRDGEPMARSRSRRTSEILSADAATKLRVFLSYGHDEHAELAVKIRESLEERGHEVWFDEQRLKSGRDWEQYIEDGLEWVATDKSIGRVVIIMTPHSVRRPDGFCLNELARAVDRKSPIIPVMAVWAEPPLTICRLQWLDMRDCIPLGQFGARFPNRFALLVDALENGTDVEGAQSMLTSRLDPLPFDAELALYQPRFTGRDWLFAKVREWLDAAAHSRVFWITGKPGIGKTAFSTVLFSKFREVGAVHFCVQNHDRKSDPVRLVKSIAYQLSTQLPNYAARLTSLRDFHELTAEKGGNAETLFDMLVVQPLHGGFPKPDRTMVILIDALDEAIKYGRNELAEFLHRQFAKTPDWMRLIITSGPEPELVPLLSNLDPEVIDAASEENLRDIRQFLERELKPFAGNGRVPKDAVDEIIERSEGIFLYAECVMQGLTSGQLSLDRVQDFPRDLNDYFRLFFERRFSDRAEYKSVHRPLIAAVIAAREPLTVDYLSDIFGWTEHERGSCPNALGSLFPCENGMIRPFHRRITEWLTERDPDTNVARCGDDFFVGFEEGNRILGDKGRKEYRAGGFGALSDYARRHLPHHLAAMRQWADLTALLADSDYFMDAYQHSFDDLCAWWVVIEKYSSHRASRAYVPSSDGQQTSPWTERSKGRLLMHFGHMQEALALFEAAERLARERDEQEELSGALGNQALIHQDWGELDRAMDLHKEEERLCRELGNKDGLQACLGNQALIHQAWGELDRAMDLLKEQERICREMGNKNGLSRSLGNQALIHKDWGELDRAMELLKEQEQICRELGNKEGLSISLGNQALIHQIRGELDRAMDLHKEKERICRELGNKNGLSRSLGNQALIHADHLEDQDTAFRLLEEAYRLATDLRNPDLMERMGAILSKLKGEDT